MDAVTPADIEEQRRLNWRDFHPEKYCHRCGRRNVHSWSAPSPLWNAVLRDPVTGGDRWGILCPPCFAELAEESILPAKRTHWYFQPEGVDIASLWDDRDGRVWNAERQLWEEVG